MHYLHCLLWYIHPSFTLSSDNLHFMRCHLTLTNFIYLRVKSLKMKQRKTRMTSKVQTKDIFFVYIFFTRSTKNKHFGAPTFRLHKSKLKILLLTFLQHSWKGWFHHRWWQEPPRKQRWIRNGCCMEWLSIFSRLYIIYVGTCLIISPRNV